MMKQVELLAPAGGMDSLQAAIQAGCDAVYLGGEMFGARAFASNFDRQQIQEAIRYAHRYGVKVYVTMNTLIYDDEMEEAVQYARFLYTHDVDALLIQDIGLCDRIHQEMPDLELHASTQMHIHNAQGVETAKKLGISRVVVPRESTIEEIAAMTKYDVDIEAFVHGALCLCYSGQCLMSSTLFGRSGNRGECAQPCRMRYSLWEKGQNGDRRIETKGNYLLSPKDLFTLQELPSLLDSGIRSLKIEGRMKKPEYVAQVVSMYRKAIDAWASHHHFSISKQETDDLRQLFSRGFTDGYAFHAPGTAMMNPFRPNHQGILLGKVVSVSKQRIKIQLTENLHQGDGIRIIGKAEDEGCIVNRLYHNGKLVAAAHAGETVEIDHKIEACKGAQVRKTTNAELQNRIRQTYADARHVKVTVQVQVEAGKPLSCQITDEEGFHVEVQSEQAVQQAKNAPMKEEAFQTAFAQLGDTPFQLDTFQCTISGQCFMSVGQIKQVRRTAVAQLLSKREHRHPERRFAHYERSWHPATDPLKLFACVQSLEQYQACKEAGIANVLTTSRQLYNALYEKGETIAFHEGNIVKGKQEACMGGENGALSMGRQIVDATLNITNKAAAAFASAQGVQTIVLSLEHDMESIQQLCASFAKEGKCLPDLALMIYGYRDLMTSRTCLINTYCKDGRKQGCSLCRKHTYYLKDEKGRIFPFHNDECCNMRILHTCPDDHIEQMKQYQALGISSFYLRFTIESKEETKKILQRTQEQMDQ